MYPGTTSLKSTRPTESGDPLRCESGDTIPGFALAAVHCPPKMHPHPPIYIFKTLQVINSITRVRLRLAILASDRLTGDCTTTRFPKELWLIPVPRSLFPAFAPAYNKEVKFYYLLRAEQPLLAATDYDARTHQKTAFS